MTTRLALLMRGDETERANAFTILTATGQFTPQEIGRMTFEQQFYICLGLKKLYGIEDTPTGTVRTFRNLQELRQWQTLTSP